MKKIQIQKVVVPLVISQTKSISCPAEKPVTNITENKLVVNRLSNANFVPLSVYIGFRLFVLMDDPTITPPRAQTRPASVMSGISTRQMSLTLFMLVNSRFHRPSVGKVFLYRFRNKQMGSFFCLLNLSNPKPGHTTGRSDRGGAPRGNGEARGWIGRDAVRSIGQEDNPRSRPPGNREHYLERLFGSTNCLIRT